MEEYRKKECYVERSGGKTDVKNILWDGMGLIDESLFPKDGDMAGFIYCRSHFFKSCLFRGNIQDYFRDFYGDKYDTATVRDMFGNVFGVRDIKVIITENSIKWIKFMNLMGNNEKLAYQYYVNYMREHGEKFAIVKTAHKSKWGDLQRSSYQMNNSLPTTENRILERIAEISIDYCNSLKTDHEAFIRHLKYEGTNRYSINNVLIALDEWNSDFKYTEFFKKKKTKIISDFKDKRLKQGKLLQYGDNLTICGNPVSLLMKVTGQNFLNEGCFEKMEDAIQCYTTRFKDGERLAGFRSPHNSPNNIVHLVNNRSQLIERYFPNLGDNVIIINGIYTDVQSRLNGQDLDTDSIYTTNQKDVVELAKIAYLDYPTIINDIDLKGDSNYNKDMQSYSNMDNKIAAAQYAIGYASNIAQLALSYYYDKKNNNEKADKQLEDVFIICSVLAQVAIDSAKREYDVNFNSELKRLAFLPCMLFNGDKKYPRFYADVQKENGSKKKKADIKPEEIQRFNCPMEILAEIIENRVIDIRENKQLETSTKPLKVVFQYKKANDEKKHKQYNKIISIVEEYDKAIKNIDKTDKEYSRKVNMEFDETVSKTDAQKTKSQVEAVFAKDGWFKKKSKKPSEYKEKINQVLSEKNDGKVLTSGGLKQLREIFNTDNNGIYQAMVNLHKAVGDIKNVKGFKNGGIAKLAKSKGEDGLTLARNGEGFIAPENVKDIQNLVNITPDLVRVFNPLANMPSMPNVTPVTQNMGGNIGNIEFNIEMNGVNDVETFSKQIREAYCYDKNLRKMIQCDNIYQLDKNASRLDRNKYR